MSTQAHKILLVEDEAIIAMDERHALEDYGYSVVLAHNGRGAIQFVEQDPTIELVLMDIDLGSGMDGTEAAEVILARRDLPIIFLSSHTEREIVEKTEGISSYGYVVKNSGITVLDAAIKMAFRLFEANRSIKKTNMELEASNEQLRVTNEEVSRWQNLLEYIVYHDRSAVAILDRELVFLYVSKHFSEDYGIDGDLVGRHHYEAVPEVPDKWRAIHQRALAGEVLSSDLDSFERADGRVDYVTWECRPWYTGDGSVGGIVLYTQVITDRVLEERRYRTLLENSPNIVYLFSTTRGGVFWSEATRRILGYDPADVTRDPFLWNRSIHPDDQELVTRGIHDAIEGKPFDIEYRIRASDGSWVWLRDRLIDRSVFGDEVIIQGHAEDITEGKAAEARIIDYQWRLESIIEGAQVGTWQWDIQTGEVIFDENWAAIVGYTLDELKPLSIQTWESLTMPEDLLRAQQSLERHFSGELSYYDIELRMQHKEGHTVWVRDRGKVTSWTADGEPKLMFGTHSEITDRKEAELRAEDLLREKEELLQEVHHRTKNNMNTIRSLLSLKARETEDATVQEALLDSAARLNAMQVLYDQLYRSNDYHALPASQYIEGLASQVASLFPGSEQIHLTATADPVELDSKRLSSLGMIVTEWITNAFKHAFDLEGTAPENAGIRIVGERTERGFRLIFSNYGGRVPRPESFERADGFGLRMVAAVVDQLDGTLETEVNEEVRFTLEFPL